MKQALKEIELMEQRHKEEMDELRDVIKEMATELKGIQWKIAAATGGGIAVVSLIDHLLQAKGLK